MYEVAGIEGHCEQDDGTYAYLTSWKHTALKTWVLQQDFIDKAILSRYWKHQPKSITNPSHVVVNNQDDKTTEFETAQPTEQSRRG